MDVIAQQGDTVEKIAWRIYRDVAMTQAIYAANRRLSYFGAVIPLGTKITLPPQETKEDQNQQPLKLWD